MQLRKWLMTVTLFSLAVGAAAAGDDGFVRLFNGKDLTGWKIVLKEAKTDKDVKGDPAKSFVVKDGEIQVPGVMPFGYIHTEKEYSNYVIKYSWTYPKNQPEKTTMNSGLLIHINPPHKVWPHCIEPQGRYMDHGKLFFMGFKAGETKSTFDEAALKKALKPHYEWQTTVTTARGDGTIEVRVNDALISTGSAPLTKGMIGFQSEGAPASTSRTSCLRKSSSSRCWRSSDRTTLAGCH